MQIVSLIDNMHEVSKPIFWRRKNKQTYHEFVACWISPESGIGL